MADSPGESRSDILPLLGTQLFAPEHFAAARGATVVMCEDRRLCTYVRHHKHKLVLMLAAMRAHAQSLRDAGFDVRYQRLDDTGNAGLEDWLRRMAADVGAERLVHFPFEGRHIEARIYKIARELGLEPRTLPGPMFVQTLEDYDAHVDNGKAPFMARYYKQARQRHGLLVEADGEPTGGRWSFDAENRERLPDAVDPPPPSFPEATAHVRDCQRLVDAEFATHPGTTDGFWIPTTRVAACAWLDEFLDQRLARFGPYEDALSQRSEFLFHSALSPLMNLGLLTPREVLDAALERAGQAGTPLASLEGFVRQILGWREFVRAVYHRHGAAQSAGNFWGHRRELTDAWYDGTTGIPPLDDAIALARRRAWNHHIQRLMVIGNLMTLAEIRPRAAYRWFMEMYADAYPWVMEPNVYGMALFSDGGLFATKPYVCGSNYLRKMSDYGRGDWCDTVDGLYWRFVERHRDFFGGNPRLTMILGTLDRMSAARRERIFPAAEAFLSAHTSSPG